MSADPHASPHWLRQFYFWSGVVATVSYRAIVVLNHLSKGIALAAWYLGTVGFVIYFIHRYQISEKRAQLIKEQNLIQAVNRAQGLTPAQIEANEYILRTLVSTKEKWNYIVIFATSILALLIGIYLDFLTP